MVEVGQYVGAAAPQGAPELGQFLQLFGNAAAQRGDGRGHHGLAATSVGVGVGGDHLLVEALADLDAEVVLVGENGFQPGLLACAEQRAGRVEDTFAWLSRTLPDLWRAEASFANEIAQICEALDNDGLNIDYDKVVEYAKFDKRLGDTHWSVPGPVPTHDGRYVRGFGGHCFPKDINALMSVATHYGIDPKVMRAAWEKTLEVRGPRDRDWEFQVGRAVSDKSVRCGL